MWIFILLLHTPCRSGVLSQMITNLVFVKYCRFQAGIAARFNPTAAQVTEGPFEAYLLAFLP